MVAPVALIFEPIVVVVGHTIGHHVITQSLLLDYMHKVSFQL
jgi:hypothetical protein